MLHVSHYKDPVDTKTFHSLVRLYEGVYPIAPVLHQALTGFGDMHIFVVIDDDQATRGMAKFAHGPIVGAGILKTPEAAVPIGADINPVAWVVGDMITHPKYRRQGVGRLLLKHMEGVVIRNGGRILYLFTADTNEPAKCLYERAGFLRLMNQRDQAIYAKVIVDNPDVHLTAE